MRTSRDAQKVHLSGSGSSIIPKKRDLRRRFRKFSLFTAFALSGCVHTRFVTSYCLTHDQQLPSEPAKVKDKLTGQADKDLTIVAGSAVRLRAWGEGLNTILEGCREPPVK